MYKVIILGNDHTNSVGLVQSFGVKGVYVIAVLWGNCTGFVKSSKYTKEIYSSSTPESCVELIAQLFNNSTDTFVIIPACDHAAVCLEKYRNKLNSNILFEYTSGTHSIRELENKNLQVEIAAASGFDVPQSWYIEDVGKIPSNISYPCLIKPLASFEGSKADLIVCNNYDELHEKLSLVLSRTPKVLLQQYIVKDMEYTTIGCSLKDGRTYIPFIIEKLDIWPKNVGLESVVRVIDLEEDIRKNIQNYMKKIGYVGVFSVELMRSKIDGKKYFTEANLRNDGDNGFVLKAGCNVPFVHYTDMIGAVAEDELKKTCRKETFIWEMHHFMSVMTRSISIAQWIKDLRQSKGFLTYLKGDTKPFYKQFTNLFLKNIRLRKETNY